MTSPSLLYFRGAVREDGCSSCKRSVIDVSIRGWCFGVEYFGL
jgi:hypothetical protein